MALEDLFKKYSEKQLKNPDGFGEFLRSIAFVPDGQNTLGCYDTFKVNAKFKKVDAKSEFGKRVLHAFIKAECYFDNGTGDCIDSEGHPCSVQEAIDEFLSDFPSTADNLYSSGDVHMAWMWDGDGSLFFIIPELGKTLINTDCKKDHGWKWGEWQ